MACFIGTAKTQLRWANLIDFQRLALATTLGGATMRQRYSPDAPNRQVNIFSMP